MSIDVSVYLLAGRCDFIENRDVKILKINLVGFVLNPNSLQVFLRVSREVERGKSLRDLNRIRLLNSQSDLDHEIGIVRDMSETLVLLT